LKDNIKICLKKWGVECKLYLPASGYDSVALSWECINEPSDLIKDK
jgi:hypothetical protein